MELWSGALVKSDACLPVSPRANGYCLLCEMNSEHFSYIIQFSQHVLWHNCLLTQLADYSQEGNQMSVTSDGAYGSSSGREHVPDSPDTVSWHDEVLMHQQPAAFGWYKP